MIARRKLANIYAVAAMKKALKHSVPGHMTTTIQRSIFFHPDYTVGSGISPNQPCWTCAKQRSRTVTAGREFHPALKIYFVLLYQTIAQASYSSILTPEDHDDNALQTCFRGAKAG